MHASSSSTPRRYRKSDQHNMGPTLHSVNTASEQLVSDFSCSSVGSSPSTPLNAVGKRHSLSGSAADVSSLEASPFVIRPHKMHSRHLLRCNLFRTSHTQEGSSGSKTPSPVISKQSQRPRNTVTIECQKDLKTGSVPESSHVKRSLYSGNFDGCSKEDIAPRIPLHVKEQELEKDTSMLDDSYSFSADKSDWEGDDFDLKNCVIKSQEPSPVRSSSSFDSCFPFFETAPVSTDASGRGEIMPQTEPKDYLKKLNEKPLSNTVMKKRRLLCIDLEHDDPTNTKSDHGSEEPPAILTVEDCLHIPLPVGPSPPPVKEAVTASSVPTTSTSSSTFASSSQWTSPRARCLAARAMRNHRRKILLENVTTSSTSTCTSSSSNIGRRLRIQDDLSSQNNMVEEDASSALTATRTNGAGILSRSNLILSKPVTSVPSFTVSHSTTSSFSSATQSIPKSALTTPSVKKRSSFHSNRFSNGNYDCCMGPSGISSSAFDSSSESEKSPAALVQRKAYHSLPDYNANPWLPADVRLVDTHCHLDFLFNRSEMHSCQLHTLSDFRQLKAKYAFPSCYEGCVAVFCEPSIYSMPDYYTRILAEEGVWGAFGVHPHHAHKYNEIVEDNLCRALKNENVRAFGEIGLDYSNRNGCPRNVQHEVFRQQLKIAIKRNLPLVIHCRDAEDDCLRIMKEMVPREHKIHRHCFTGHWSEAQRWLREFPNLYIGLTPVVTYPTAKSVHEVATCIPLNRLVLETDAPYFVPRKVSKKECPYSYPGLVIHTASQIASLRNIGVAELLRVVRNNTTQVYGI